MPMSGEVAEVAEVAEVTQGHAGVQVSVAVRLPGNRLRSRIQKVKDAGRYQGLSRCTPPRKSVKVPDS